MSNLGDLALNAPIPRIGQRAGFVGAGGGNFTTASGSFVDLTGATATIGAVVNDNIFVCFSCNWQLSAVQTAIFQAITTTGGNILQLMGYNNPTSNIAQCCLISTSYIVKSGDLSSGNIAIKIQVETTGGSTLTVFNTTNGRVPALTIVNFLQ